MTQISRDDVLHLAQLSSLQLTDQETDSLQQDISNILGYIEQLSELDTSDVEPTYQVTGLTNVWRDDVIDQSDVTREQLLALAPEQQNNSVKVPKVL
jgi:aspartyl-tRNA(Asn)/glutamyl-tRNA(Gln) amidotransferase subunit C